MINNEHKDRLFSFLFGREENRAWTLSLYNAVNGTGYTDPGEIEITTVSDALYMGMKNDVSFLLHSQMSVYEQQSTYNPNMPVRELMYVGRLYDKYVHMHGLNLYGRKQVRLPVPRLVTFYNGAEEHGDAVLRLSDAFPEGADAGQSDVEVRVRVLNVNHGRNRELMEACRPLAEYAWLVEEIRRNKREGMGIEESVDRAIDDMPAGFAIRRFLVGNRAEVKMMCITEYNEAETMRMLREEAREEGLEEGREMGRREGREMGRREGREMGREVGRREGREVGRGEGEDRMGDLIDRLLSKGRVGDIQKAAKDKSARESLYREFGIV